MSLGARETEAHHDPVVSSLRSGRLTQSTFEALFPCVADVLSRPIGARMRMREAADRFLGRLGRPTLSFADAMKDACIHDLRRLRQRLGARLSHASLAI
jgi:hypothetical protein